MINSSGRALLCDFGLSRIRHEITRTNTSINTGGRELFVAPELSEQDEPRSNEQSDIYGFAMTILRLGTGADPFKGEYKSKWMAIHMAQDGHRPRKPSTLGSLPDASFKMLWTLLEKMWAHDPAERPTATEVVGVTQQLVAATSTEEHSA